MALGENCWNTSSDWPIVGNVASPKATVTIGGHEFCHKHPGWRPPDFTYYWDKVFTSKWDSQKLTAYLPLSPRIELRLIVKEERKLASNRTFAYSFAGGITSENRKAMATEVPKLSSSKGFIHLVEQGHRHFQKNKTAREWYIDAEAYRSLLLNSVFTLSPIGNNVECFRIWEACEAGSIPVISTGAWRWKHHPCGVGEVSIKPLLDSGAPFLFVKSWEEAAAVIDRVANNPVWADQWQENIVRWYNTFLSDFANRFEARLSSRLE